MTDVMTLHSTPPDGDRLAPARLKIVQVGNSLGIVLSKELLTKLNVTRGDILHVVDSPDGIVLSPYDPEIARQVDSGQRFMKRYRDTFRALAK